MYMHFQLYFFVESTINKVFPITYYNIVRTVIILLLQGLRDQLGGQVPPVRLASRAPLGMRVLLVLLALRVELVLLEEEGKREQRENLETQECLEIEVMKQHGEICYHIIYCKRLNDSGNVK